MPEPNWSGSGTCGLSFPFLHHLPCNGVESVARRYSVVRFFDRRRNGIRVSVGFVQTRLATVLDLLPFGLECVPFLGNSRKLSIHFGFLSLRVEKLRHSGNENCPHCRRVIRKRGVQLGTKFIDEFVVVFRSGFCFSSGILRNLLFL